MLVSNQNFIIKDYPVLNPFSLDYEEFWKQEKRRCIEGYWVSGKWMPGPLYFYVNYWNILLNKTKNSKVKSIGRPFLRDLEWEKAFLYMEAKGFSGFALDTTYTCNREYLPENRLENEFNNIIPKNSLKYVPARDYLRKNHSGNLGKPLFENEAKNIVDVEARGGGKSYGASSLIGHNFLFDGATDYDHYLDSIQNKQPFSSETLVGAIDAKYSKDLLTKFQLGIENLPGSMEYNGQYYPSPFSKSFSGSLQPSKNIEQVREIKEGNNWIKKGSHSKVHHRTFADNPFAGNGTRPGLTFLEEAGFMYNLVDSLGALKECTQDGAYKFGVIWIFGTGGDMDGGSTQALQSVFYNPEGFDCLVFNDEWEGRGKIGYFVPAYMTLNQFKNEEGVSNKEIALNYLENERAKAARAKTKEPLNNELQNRPIKPSEAFLVTTGNIFPIKELKDRLAQVEGSDTIKNAEFVGKLFTNSETGEIEWKHDDKLKPIYDYPLLSQANSEGCLVIYEHPYKDETGYIPYGRYLGGCDPYDHDKSGTTSLGSTIIYDKLTKRVVAEDTGRPQTAKEYYERVRLLAKYYNAKILYENEKKGIFDYFDSKNCTYLLADQPDIIKDVVETSKVQRGKGIHMNDPLKRYGEELIKTWLVEPHDDVKDSEVLNLHKIRCIPLLKELIAYNPDGNFDRAMAFLVLMYYIQECKKIDVKRREDLPKSVYDSNMFNSKKLFSKQNNMYRKLNFGYEGGK